MTSSPSTDLQTADVDVRLPLEPMDPQLTSIQPGGGLVMRLELAWGKLRRLYLKTFRKGYLARMRELRQGDGNPCPHEVLDPRDLKFFRNQTGYCWNREDDPFSWRDRLPFARTGLAELLLFASLTLGGAVLLAALTIGLAWTGAAAWIGWSCAFILFIVGFLVLWFFRDPVRQIPQGDHLIVSPADGKVVEITELEHDEFIGGPAVRIGIFLSIFNVHVNRVPAAVRVIGLSYRPGKFLNALKPESAQENEQLTIRLESETPPHRRLIIRQITGQIARRIVCELKPGDQLEAGQRFGMIKFGSRAEIVLPKTDDLKVTAPLDRQVKGGSSILAEYGANRD